MRTELGKINESFTITPLNGQVIILDREWPCEAKIDDTLEIVTSKGEKFTTQVRDIISFRSREENEVERQLPSIMVNRYDCGSREEIIGAEVFLVSAGDRSLGI